MKSDSTAGEGGGMALYAIDDLNARAALRIMFTVPFDYNSGCI
jgi:hypothetical protein